MRKLDHLREAWNALWEATQVELQGHYTIANLQEFEQYHRTTSWRRALLVCVLSPVPCLTVLVVVDFLPLEPPSLGPARSIHLWIRTLGSVTLITFCILQQFRQHLAELALWYWVIALISVAASTSSVAFCYAMAFVIGYPVPFHMVLGTIPWGIAVVAGLLLFRGRVLLTNRSLATNVRQYLLVFICQIAMTFIYPVFNYIYSKLSSTRQTGFILMLPIIKIVAKNWISRTLPDSDDAKPEAVVFNVEIFHALFVSICMGSTTSPRTVVALMVIDFIQAWLTFADIRSLLSDLKPIAAKLAHATVPRKIDALTSPRGLEGLVSICNRVIQTGPFQAHPATRSRAEMNRTSKPRWIMASVARQTIKSIRGHLRQDSHHIGSITIARAPRSLPIPPVRSFGTHIKAASVVPESVSTAPQLAAEGDIVSLSVVERSVLVQQTQRVLFVTEFIVLIEYTEVIMPMIYCIFVVVTWNLPNRAYYPNLDGIHSMNDLVPTIFNVQLYVVLEFMSVITMGCVMWWRLRLSLLHQLAFVLEKRLANVQAKLLLWVLYTMQTSVVQLGVDYSFRFKWLRKSGE